jgi:glutathione synthase/RimK-type ligase-like ATP-grasp enzyme
MAGFYVVVDDLEDWAPYFPSRDVISFEQYMALPEDAGKGRTRVINCCRNSRALGRGYYCSLLAEARGHNVIPSVQVMNDLRRKSLWSLELEGVEAALDKLALAEGDVREQIDVKIFFGESDVPQLGALARQLFDRFPIPLLEVRLKRERGWHIQRIRQGALRDLKGEEQDIFAQALDRFSNRIWRKPRARKQYRYDMAMLVNPKEKLPPSDRTAIARFVRAGKRLGINVQLIGKQDYQRLAEYDALFIRETTSIDHHTYRFARKAEAEGLVVMDDPTSILRCTNKVYLADLLRTHRVPTPKTQILSDASAQTLESVIAELGLPVVLKIPDGSFSRGVIKVETAEALPQALKQLRQSSSLVLAQEFMYTDYDWRIGVLNNKPLYACRYFMVQDHWQIYRHEGGNADSGGFDTPATWEVPRKVLDVALKAARLIGDGFYGVDIKQSGDRVVVIEVNDNPSIDSDVEDLQLGGALYHEIMAEFLRRMELKRQMPA